MFQPHLEAFHADKVLVPPSGNQDTVLLFLTRLLSQWSGTPRKIERTRDQNPVSSVSAASEFGCVQLPLREETQ